MTNEAADQHHDDVPSRPGASTVPPASAQPTSQPPKLRLTRPHSLIQMTSFKCGGCNRSGDAQRNDWEGVDVRVSRPQFRAALIVLDRLFKGLEQRDLRVENSRAHDGNGTFATDKHDKTPVYLYEKFRRIEHVPTAKELRDKEHDSYTKIPKWDYVPTGTLVLEPGGVVDLSSEEALGQLIEKAVADIIERLAKARRGREARAELQRKEWERQRQTQEEKQRVEALHKAAAAFHQYGIVMEYIEEVRRFGRAPDDQRREDQSLDEWIRWAEWQARRIHPLSG